MILFDHTFSIKAGFRETNINHGIVIKTSTRIFKIKTKTKLQMIDIVYALKKASKHCPYIKINEHFSFAPKRENNSNCKL